MASGCFPSSPRRGGRDLNKISRSLLSGADGVVMKFRRILLRLNTTPSARAKDASRLFLDCAATPPRRGGENSASVIEIKDLVKDYKLGEVPLHVLKGISFEVERGDFVSIMGPSGSGKSTLMNILGCLDKPTSGTYTLDGISVGNLSRDELAEIRNKKIGFIFQQFNLLARTSAADNVELPLMYTDTPDHERYERAR